MKLDQNLGEIGCIKGNAYSSVLEPSTRGPNTRKFEKMKRFLAGDRAQLIFAFITFL